MKSLYQLILSIQCGSPRSHMAHMEETYTFHVDVLSSGQKIVYFY